MQYQNLSGYLFTKLNNLEDLQNNLKTQCRTAGLKGTILVSHEGINVFVAGNDAVIEAFKLILKAHQIPEIEFKISYSESIPFKRMLVKIKPEIITMGKPEINPTLHPAPYVSAQEFKRWLQDGRDLVILDTRNDYEIHVGKFKNAIDLNIDHFRQFPDACQRLPEDYKNKTVVTYCTGGIRCEKAAPYMQSIGFKHVYQLEGGIVKYLEECGKDFFEGECFVFDKRIAIDHTLHETQTVQCFKCRMPVTPEEQQSERYMENAYCPNCFGQEHKTLQYRASATV